MLSDLGTKLLEFGLHLRGSFGISDEEIELFELGGRATISLVGNIGSSYWPVFSESTEYQDELPDSLDRWSKRIAEQVANDFGVKAIYPFDGPPYFPFQQWAKRAEPIYQSPLGLLIHPQYGLWHSYRFGLLIPGDGLAGQQAPGNQSPCESCDTQPCLQSCPVGAFDSNGYDVANCTTYLKQSPGALCHAEGCLARLACPVGESYRYDSDQHCFHLSAFLMNT